MIDWAKVAGTLAPLAARARPGELLSVGLTLPRWPALGWCAGTTFWQRPDAGLRLAGWGAALAVESEGAGRFAALAAAQRGLGPGWRHDGPARRRAFSGFAFAASGGAPLPNARLWVPELCLSEQDGAVTLTLTTPAGRAATALARWQAGWQAWTRPLAVLPPPTCFAARPSPLAQQAFLARGRAALAAIAAGEADKLVLARHIVLEADAPPDPAALLATLGEHHPHCAIFGIDLGAGVFLGASPETLLAGRGEHVAIDALAGTAWRDALRAVDDEKNRREHDFVARAIAAALGELCDEVSLPEAPEVMQLPGLAHLRRRVTARRPAGLGPFDLIARLHPTPAIGGAPTAAALDWLERHGDARGAWYAGGIGWLDAAGDCDFAVALRCGLIEGRRITLYAGAGFVAGSDPAQELAETEAKLATMKAALAMLDRRQQAVA